MQLPLVIFGLASFSTLTLAGIPLTNVPGIVNPPPATAIVLPHPVVDLSWSGIMAGFEYKLNGSIESVLAQMKVLHPEFNVSNAFPAGSLAASFDKDLGITPRAADSLQGGLCCPVAGQPWTWATRNIIEDGIDYLTKLNQNIVAAPKSCGRISCSYDSGIYFCNDNDFYQSVGSPYLGSLANDIWSNCLSWHEVFPVITITTCGQAFDDGGYNVIVAEDNC